MVPHTAPLPFLHRELLSRPVPCLLWTSDSEETALRSRGWWLRWVSPGPADPGVPYASSPFYLEGLAMLIPREAGGLRDKVSPSAKPSQPRLLRAARPFMHHFFLHRSLPRKPVCLGVCLPHPVPRGALGAGTGCHQSPCPSAQGPAGGGTLWTRAETMNKRETDGSPLGPLGGAG